MSKIDDVMIPEQSKPLYIVSDFHGVYDAMDLVKTKLQRRDRRVVILGDCMDRGNEGIHILREIRALVDAGESLMYLPGNHDEAIYSKVRRFVEFYRAHKGKNDVPREDVEEFLSIFRASMKTEKYDAFAKNNGQLTTIDEIIKIIESDEGAYEFLDLMIWLEDQPILAIETDCDGRKIALGHAAFDMELYRLDKPLTLKSKMIIDRRLLELKASSEPNPEEYERIKRLHDKADACLWYRNPSDNDSINRNGIVTLPDESEADVIVVGHTPKQGEIEIIGENMTRTAIDVDGGTVECYLSGEGEMLKFEPHREGLPSKTMVTAFVVCGRKGAYEKLGLKDEYEKISCVEQEETDSDIKLYEPGVRPIVIDGDVKIYRPGKKEENPNHDESDPDDDFGDI